MAPEDGFKIFGGNAIDWKSVSSAGDFNGDGYDDLLIGGGRYDNKAYIIFGASSDDLGDINVGGDLTNNWMRITVSNEPNNWLGYSVHSVGDMNGDGYDDVIIGAPSADPGGLNNAGRAYIIYGGPDPANQIDLADPNTYEGFYVDGVTAGAELGIAVSGIGDFNGDGFEDVIVTTLTGETYVIYGSETPPSSGAIDTIVADNAKGFSVSGVTAFNTFPPAVSGLGDINGDGLDDLIIGVPTDTNKTPMFDFGATYIIYGKQDQTDIDLSDDSSFNGFAIIGDSSGDYSGFSVSGAGDINGDGFADLIIGAPLADDGNGDQTGAAYLIYGGADLARIDLSDLKSEQGFLILGENSGDYLGNSVSSAGDINGDGYDDLIVGAEYVDLDRNNDPYDLSTDGAAYVIYGGATGTEDTDPISVPGSFGPDNFTGNAGNDTFVEIGANDVVRGGAGDDTVVAVSDGFADLDGGHGTDMLAIDDVSGLTLDITAPQSHISNFEVIGLSRSNNTGNTLVLDKLSVLRQSEATVDGVTTLIVLGDSGDQIEFQDGIENWTVTTGVTETVNGQTLIFTEFTNGNARVLVEEGVSLPGLPASIIDVAALGTAGFAVEGETVADFAGLSVSDAGDVNGDGYDDVIVGAKNADGKSPSNHQRALKQGLAFQPIRRSERDHRPAACRAAKPA